MTRCPCGFPREACWRCNPPPDYADSWLDALKDMDEDKGKPKQPTEILDHERVDDDSAHRLGGD